MQYFIRFCGCCEGFRSKNKWIPFRRYNPGLKLNEAVEKQNISFYKLYKLYNLSILWYYKNILGKITKNLLTLTGT